ncbi:MAG: hypothetical protein ACREF3_03535 [Acetobacteraceae bacterium]
MSRHQIPAHAPGLSVVVRWDNPLSTHFAQVLREQDDNDERDPVVFWVGGVAGKVLRAEDLVQPLAPYAELTDDVIVQLRVDRAACVDRGPTARQRMLLACLGRTPRSANMARSAVTTATIRCALAPSASARSSVSRTKAGRATLSRDARLPRPQPATTPHACLKRPTPSRPPPLSTRKTYFHAKSC